MKASLIGLLLFLSACAAPVKQASKQVVAPIPQEAPQPEAATDLSHDQLEIGTPLSVVRESHPSMKFSKASYSFVREGMMDTVINVTPFKVTAIFDYTGHVEAVEWNANSTLSKDGFFSFVQSLTTLHGAPDYINDTVAIWADSSYTGVRIASLTSGRPEVRSISHSSYTSHPYFTRYKPKRTKRLDASTAGVSSSNTLPAVNSTGSVSVKGYYRKDGTYVRPHKRRK